MSETYFCCDCCGDCGETPPPPCTEYEMPDTVTAVLTWQRAALFGGPVTFTITLTWDAGGYGWTAPIVDDVAVPLEFCEHEDVFELRLYEFGVPIAQCTDDLGNVIADHPTMLYDGTPADSVGLPSNCIDQTFDSIGCGPCDTLVIDSLFPLAIHGVVISTCGCHTDLAHDKTPCCCPDEGWPLEYVVTE